MARHIAPRRFSRSLWRALTSVRLRAVLCLGLVFALGAAGTTAYWTDEASVATGAFSASSLDLRLSGNLEDFGGTWENTDMAAADLIPGESVAFGFTLDNAGTVAFDVTATGDASGALAVAGGLTFAVYTGGAPSNSGSSAAGDRTGTCTGTQRFAHGSLAAAATVIDDPGVLVGTGESVDMCIAVMLPASAPNSLQDASATVVFDFLAKQAVVP